MGRDVCIVDDRWSSFSVEGECGWTGAKGYLRDPAWSSPSEESEINFFIEATKILENMHSHSRINFEKNYKAYFKQFFMDKKLGEKTTFKYIYIIKIFMEHLYIDPGSTDRGIFVEGVFV